MIFSLQKLQKSQILTLQSGPNRGTPKTAFFAIFRFANHFGGPFWVHLGVPILTPTWDPQMDPWRGQHISHFPQDLIFGGAILGLLLGDCLAILEGNKSESTHFGPSNFARGGPKGVVSGTPFRGVYSCNSNVFG